MEEPDLTRTKRVEWRESDDVHRPQPRPLQEFLSSIRLQDTLTGAEPQVFVHRAALDAMLADAAVDLRRERGGVLVGESFEDVGGRYYVAITRAVPAAGADGTPTHLQFTPQSWQAISRAVGLTEVIHGWYHTHPGLGVFMSGTDRRTQQAFFSKPWQIAVVIDPHSHEIGFFHGEAAARVAHVTIYEDASAAASMVSTERSPPVLATTLDEATAARAAPPSWVWFGVAGGCLAVLVFLVLYSGPIVHMVRRLLGWTDTHLLTWIV